MSRNRLVLDAAIILGIIVFTFVNIGVNDVQSWDEGLYAVRARAVVEKGLFFDQTEGSIAGLYSSTYPPLTVWAMAASIKIFGDGETSVRLFSFLCSAASAVLIYLVARKIFDKKLAITAPIALFGSLVWLKYSRFAQTDVPLATFILLCFYAYLHLREKSGRKFALWPGVFALSFACALMTKLLKSFAPSLFVLALMFEPLGKNKKSWIVAAAFLAVGAAFPWYLHMTLRHGSDFAGALLAPHLYSEVESNVPALGPFYYVNKLIDSGAIYSLLFLLPLAFFNRKFREGFFKRDRNVRIVLMIWFYGVFLVFSAATTKLPHYTLYLTIPGILLALIFFGVMLDVKPHPRLLFAGAGILLISTIWSFSFELRQQTKQMISLELSIGAVLFLCLIIVLIGAASLIKRNTVEKISVPAFALTFAVALAINAGDDVSYVFSEPNGPIYGGERLIENLDRSGDSSYLLVQVQAYANDTIKPQLDWYSGGALSGFSPGKTVPRIDLPPGSADSARLRKIEDYPDLKIVYEIPRNDSLAKIIREFLRDRRTRADSIGSYEVWRKSADDPN